MTNFYFSLLTPDRAIMNGQHVLQDTGSVYNGNLVRFVGGTSGSIGLSTGSAIGMAYDLKAMVELPATQELVADLGGNYCNYASGNFYALLGDGLFHSGSLPSIDAALYDAGNGKIHTVGPSKIGRCLSHQTVQHKDGAISVARCVFDFSELL